MSPMTGSSVREETKALSRTCRTDHTPAYKEGRRRRGGHPSRADVRRGTPEEGRVPTLQGGPRVPA